MFMPTIVLPRHHHNCGCGCDCDCECRRSNFYNFPVPRRRPIKHLSAVELTIHEDEFVRHECIRGRCCEPEPVVVKDAKKSFIITAETECVLPGYFYQLDIDRDVPCEVCGLDTFIRVVPCGFFRDRVGLNFSKTIHGCGCEHGHEHEHEHGEGHMHHEHVEFGDGRWCEEGPIPGNPAEPGRGFVCAGGFREREDGKAHLLPVKLDLLSNTAVGDFFFTSKHKLPGMGRPYDNRFMLYLSNAGEFILNRNFRRRSDFN